MIRFTLIALFLMCITPVYTQEKIISEGFASLVDISEGYAQRLQKRLQREKPQISLEETKIYMAQKKALRDSRRNLAEYLYGISFKFIAGKFHYNKEICRGFISTRGNCSYRTLPSKIILATRELSNPPDILLQNRMELEIYEITGYCKEKGLTAVQTLKKARINAFEKIARKIIKQKGIIIAKDEAGQDKKGKEQIITGKIYIVETITDKFGPPYEIKLKMQVELNKE